MHYPQSVNSILINFIVPNVWIRPPNQRKEADAAKQMYTVPDGDHLTMLNVYNHYQQSECHYYYMRA